MSVTYQTLRDRFLQTGEDAWLPIVDAHMHFWNPQENYHPWLCDEPPIPFRYGDYRTIRQPFLPPHYQALAGEHRVVGTVYMEAEWDPEDSLGEALWVHGLAAESGWPNAMIGQAWLDRADVEEQLVALSCLSRVRGVRHKPAVLSRTEYRPDHRLPGSMRCPHWQRGYAALAQHDLLCELQTPWWHLPDLLPLLERFPQVQVVINHAGVPGDRDQETLRGWQAAMAQLASFAQVSVKISGLGIAGRRWDLEDNRYVIEQLLALFGPERCLFASNFPVDSLVTDLEPLWSAFKQVSAGYSAQQRLDLFSENAIRLYRLKRSELQVSTPAAG